VIPTLSNLLPNTPEIAAIIAAATAHLDGRCHPA